VRTGAELVRASQVYAKEDRAQSWRLLIATLAVHAAGWAVILGSELLAVQIAASVLLGLTGIRLFIFYHDWCHDAIFTDGRLGPAIMTAVGFYTLAVPSVWRETHNYHHRNNARLIGSSIGSYPTVSLPMYRSLPNDQRRLLKIVRHPLTIAGGLLTTFFVGVCIAAWRRDPKQHGWAPISGLIWIAIFLGLGFGFGWTEAVLLWLVPGAIHSAMGSYLFYAQHNFPGIELRGRRDWEYTHAALRCSSYFEMPALMHWFTGNIGYHHVHHLNHRIPFYRLPEAMAGMPELQDPIRTSWRPADVIACLKCAVWDPDSNRMISFTEADARSDEAALAAK
jgi:omega-6 fatty acid desaturase (delta-12 desaturase)